MNGDYAPGSAGFNLADVGSADELNALPSGVKGLVYLGMTDGVTAAFKAAVDACKGNPNLYGFYMVDEPGASATTAANLKAEVAYIKANIPGAITYMTEQNLSSETNPSFYYTPANTGIDLYGLDPYPVQTNVPNNLDYNIIPLAVAAAQKAGIPLASIVPVYQAFGGGGYDTYILPTPEQAQQILATWASVTPNPAFDFAYSWGTQNGDTALATDPSLLAVFAAHNASNPPVDPTPAPDPTPVPDPTPHPQPPTLTIADTTLTVAPHGSIDLGIKETAPAGATNVKVTITGLPRYETITDKLDGKTFSGSSITLTAAQVNSGLTLTSNYRRSGHPTATLTLTASDTVAGVAYTSTAQSMTIATSSTAAQTSQLALLNQAMAGDFGATSGAASLSVAATGLDQDHGVLSSPRHH
ncbi:hypothetical protein GJ654_14250 [Rhodoblastus acidophilus]|uniref:Uncharacterized protein n=1 Tax=Rhodoblastus acidophilus TaxID=1074 RepID=A0A6N8DP16_RHOAC|nr:hypothetical protein [Rhodoblastus acidophilus]MCW2275181.1 hypothetical protein [Rhodoblastus acidophilus]MTV32147.1 hypothetical protein [Rhodoblastus acidophilus]